MFLAHIRENGAEQLALAHCRNNARYTGKCLQSIGLKETGYLLGLIHDCGKFKEEFQNYLRDSNGIRGSVNHTFAPVRLLLERYHNSSNEMEILISELLAFAAGSHHGLFDCVDENRNSGFLHRMKKENIGFSESIRNFMAECVSENELDEYFAKAVEELTAVFGLLGGEDYQECQFKLGLLARLLLSALIEGDRRDTAEFMTGIQRSAEPEDMHSFWTSYCIENEEKHYSPTPQGGVD